MAGNEHEVNRSARSGSARNYPSSVVRVEDLADAREHPEDLDPPVEEPHPVVGRTPRIAPTASSCPC